MKRIFSIVLLTIYFIIAVSAQKTYPTPTAEETKEAKELAVKFYNRLTETQDVKPLIKEFFISDFNRRLNVCFKADSCGGHNRDFWKEFDGSFTRVKAKVDFQRGYIAGMNLLYLYFRVYAYLYPDIGDVTKDIPENVVSEIVKLELSKLLNNEPQLLKSALDIFQPKKLKSGKSSDFEMPKFRTKREFFLYIQKIEKMVATLRLVEAKWRTKRQTSEQKLNFDFSPEDFWVDIEESSNFFNYPDKRMVEVWDDHLPPHKTLLFKMDLVKENGKLRIVAIYPPID
jgi:hypothetical protein